MKSEKRVISGKSVRVGGRTITPVVEMSLWLHDTGGVISAKPVGIRVTEDGTEYYIAFD